MALERPPSATKQQVISSLGCDEDAYKCMLKEASEGRDRLSFSPASLTSASMNDPNVRQPYKWDQLSETAKHREILNIFGMASSYTRPYYELARRTNEVRQGDVVEENWAIRWFIWHSFRYRDNKERSGPRATVDQVPAGQNAQTFYDPVYGQYMHRS